MFKGHNIWTTKKGSFSGQYEAQSKEDAQKQRGIELQDKTRKKVDAYGFTIQDRDGSEDNIVNCDRLSETTVSSSHSITNGAEDIMMGTHEVVVESNHGGGGQVTIASRWVTV
jgi:hypothetical protein